MSSQSKSHWLWKIVSIAQLSVLLLLNWFTVTEPMPLAPTAPVTSLQFATGGSLSTTVTVKEQVALRPPAVAVAVTVEVP